MLRRHQLAISTKSLRAGSGDTVIGPVELCVEFIEDSVDGFTLSHCRRENIVRRHGQRIAKMLRLRSPSHGDNATANWIGLRRAAVYLDKLRSDLTLPFFEVPEPCIQRLLAVFDMLETRFESAHPNFEMPHPAFELPHLALDLAHSAFQAVEASLCALAEAVRRVTQRKNRCENFIVGHAHKVATFRRIG